MESYSPVSRKLQMFAVGSLCLFPALAIAKPPAGQKGNRSQANRGAATGNPMQIASKMIAQHDQNQDSELRGDELAAALTAQRQTRGEAGPSQNRQRGQKGGKQGKAARGTNASGQRGAKAGSGKPRSGRQGSGKPGSGRQGVRRSGQGAQYQRGSQNQPGSGARNSGQRGANPAPFAANLIRQFDQNQSGGLDVTELSASIQALRQNRGGKEGAGANGRSRNMAAEGGSKTGNGRAKRGDGEARPTAAPGGARAANAGGTADRKGRPGNGQANRQDIEPGTGVVPKRPGS